MDYLVAGWNKFNFLLTPESLEKILAEYHLVIFNAHVPADYTRSDLKEYMTAYGALYEMLLSGEKIEGRRVHSLFLHRGITSNLANCTYGKFHEYEGKTYKCADFAEPVVGLSPMALYIVVGEDKKPHFSTAYSYIAYSEYYMGVQMQFPKNIQYMKNGDYEPLKSTQYLKSYGDYERLKNSIKGIAHTLSIKTAEGAAKRTDILVDDETKGKLNGCYTFMQNGITVK